MMSAKTVLIIEDDDVLVSVIEELLKFDGLNVRIARNAAAGIQLSTEILPDLILCDINLPHISGYRVFETLRNDSRTNHIPFLFMTAAHDFDEIQQKASIERENIISKPFDVSAFLATIHRWV